MLSSVPPCLQAKRRVESSADPFEREADRMAHAITGSAAPAFGAGAPWAPRGAEHGRSEPLPTSVRAQMEPRFGVDFSAVRIHADTHAAIEVRKVGAQAFTLGRDIYFDAGQYRPHASSGRWLLAHELTHVVQQGGGTDGTRHPGAGPISRAPYNHLQRRTAAPIRSDATRTFTYPLEVYTVDPQSLAEAQAVRDTLNAFEGTILDYDTMQAYTVRFHVRVFPPPDPDVLEKEMGIRLHYRIGKKRLKKRAYQRAAQRHWVKVLSQSGNRQNLYLGQNRPVAETKQYIESSAAGSRSQLESDTIRHYRQQIQQAEKAGLTDEAERLRGEYHQTLAELRTGEASVQARLDDPEGIQGSLGSTFPGGVIQMRKPVGSPGTDAYQHNDRLHEFMHLLGRAEDPKTLEQTVMSYPFLNKRKATDDVLTPQPADVEGLVRQDNPPPPSP